MKSELPFYFTGKPCLRGHIAKRYTKHASCTKCNEIKRAEYIKNNGEKYISAIRKSRMQWRLNNPTRVKYQAVKSRAKRDGIPFSLEISDFSIPSHCRACDVEFDLESRQPGSRTPSIDRVDNSKGYQKDNVEIICNRCNSIKRDCTIKDLERLIRYMQRL